MAKPSVTDSEIARLDEERHRADTAYNEALTRVDRALVHDEPLVPPPAPPEYPHQIAINDRWQVIPPDPFPYRGWRRRVAGIAWRIVGPFFLRQQAFNASLVNHINEQVAHEREAAAAVRDILEAWKRESGGLTRLQSELVQYLQQITAYIDTRDRREVAGLRRHIEERAIALAAGLNAVSDEVLRRWESTIVREQRYEAAQGEMRGAVDEIRASLAGFQRTASMLSREVERLAHGMSNALPPPRDVPAAPVAERAGESSSNLDTRIDSAKYLGFEDEFRGSPDDIRSRVLDYLPLFEGSSDVLDIGCGRGEFLELLRAHGISGRGIDVNHAMVEACRERGLEVAEGDAVAYLESLDDASLGGALAIQVVEHLQAEQLLRLIDLAYRKLRPGARIVLETINPACWYAFFASYIRDITHVHPIHPDTLRYLLIASGFQQVEIRFREPFPEHGKLQPVAVAGLAELSPALAETAETLNDNVAKLNDLLFTYLDYAAVGTKGM